MSVMTMRRMVKSLTLVLISVGVSMPAMGWLLPREERSTVASAPAAAEESALAAVLSPTVHGSVGVSFASPLTSLLAASAVTSFAGPPYYHFGDVNGDGKTDLLDFSIIKANFGQQGPSIGRGDGDVTGDMLVGLDDFSILKKYFGAMSPYLP